MSNRLIAERPLRASLTGQRPKGSSKCDPGGEGETSSRGAAEGRIPAQQNVLDPGGLVDFTLDGSDGAGPEGEDLLVNAVLHLPRRLNRSLARRHLVVREEPGRSATSVENKPADRWLRIRDHQLTNIPDEDVEQ